MLTSWMREKMKNPKKEDEESDSSSESSKKVHSCPICGHGAYLNARSVHQHVVRHHPNYKELYMNKLKGKIKYSTEKKLCNMCHVRICECFPTAVPFTLWDWDWWFLSDIERKFFSKFSHLPDLAIKSEPAQKKVSFETSILRNSVWW